MMFLLALMSVFLFAPALLSAANANLEGGDTEIQVTVSDTTITLITSGTHSVDSLIVRDSDFDVVITKGSLNITSAGKYNMTVSPSQYGTFSCGSSESKLELQASGDTATTITVTPKTTTCSAGGGGGGGGGSSGGGGGGGSAADAFTSTAVVAVTPAATIAAPAATGPSSNAELSSLINHLGQKSIFPCHYIAKFHLYRRLCHQLVSFQLCFAF